MGTDTLKPVILSLRCAQALFAMAGMVLIAYVAEWWSQVHRQMAPAEVTFIVFISIFSLLIIAANMIVSTARFERYSNPLTEICLDGLLMVCWFGGFIALPVFLKQRICFGTVCKMAYASVAFAALEWPLFGATMICHAIRLCRKQGPESPEKDLESDVEVVQVFVDSKK